MANCWGCGSKWDYTQTAPVGSFPANNFGLYDMVGNVWEWVEDCYHPNYEGAPTDGSAWIATGTCRNRVVRGASWGNAPGFVRSAGRLETPPDYRSYTQGFRVARTLSAGAGAITVAPGAR
jgi:formylglycine-generating enzyme required for sulfatase activity